MSTYEKIASVLVGIGVIVALVFSYHEITEPKGNDHDGGPNFEQSVGPNLVIGSFTAVLNQESSGPLESNCKPLEPVLIGTLHDIDVHLEEMHVYTPGAFAVDRSTLNLFCHERASITMSNDAGYKLILEKQPFTRNVPHGGASDDIGTKVHIDATLIAPGAVPPTSPTTYGEQLIPDKYLDRDDAQ